jgi:hypothetical protein
MWSPARGLLEFTAGLIGLVKAFAGIESVSGGLARFSDFDEVQRVGVVLFGLLIADAVYRIGSALHDRLAHPANNSGVPNKKPTKNEKLAWLVTNRVELRNQNIDVQAVLRQMRDED